MDATRLTTRSAGTGPGVDAVIAAVAGHRCPAVLDSAAPHLPGGRYTIACCDPVEVIAWHRGDADPFEGMRQRLARQRVDAGGHDVPFPCGWIGYFAYEAGRYIERLPATTACDVGLPIARFAFYDSAAIHDAATGEWTIVAVDTDNDRPTAAARIAAWMDRLARAEAPPPVSPPSAPAPIHNMTRGAYLAKVERAREYIAAGDIFQVNFARRETFVRQEPPLRTYLRLRRTNPATYGAYLHWQERGREAAVLSASPELFLRLDADGRVTTRPIKGTRPRGEDAETDAALRMQLARSPKDRAELAMIVDLERNDLGRVCEYGTVRVRIDERSSARPYELEAHPTVHHLVATVTGRLAGSHDGIDLLRAAFPGGSITGAPKIRAMEIIDELEPTERSVYTGAIGCLGLDGSMTFNIAIRTMIVVEDRVHVYGGGGIVADSVPADEYDETAAKIRGLCAALGAPQGHPAGVAP